MMKGLPDGKQLSLKNRTKRRETERSRKQMMVMVIKSYIPGSNVSGCVELGPSNDLGPIGVKVDLGWLEVVGIGLDMAD